ncbi:MAG: penicillin acylase family protein [bacterium]|nr:penicillin acylase family protein [bacterium]
MIQANTSRSIAFALCVGAVLSLAGIAGAQRGPKGLLRTAPAKLRRAAPPGPSGPLSQAPFARVYRDPHGVPHIEANSETQAWYALGFEAARDGLLYVQASAKIVRGEAVKYLAVPINGVLPQLRTHLLTDMLTQIMGTYPTNLTAPQLRSLFAPSDPTITGNFYDNCVAYAAGVNAFRETVRTATNPATAEHRLKSWLQNPTMTGNGVADFSWVFLEPVDALDFVWYGRWLNAYLATNTADFKAPDVNSSGASYGLLGSGGNVSAVIEPPNAAGESARLAQLKKLFAGLPGMGSSGYCWSRDYCQETSGSTVVTYSGLMADPQGPKFAGVYGAPPDFMRRFLGFMALEWFAHVKVTLPNATEPSLDAYGTIPFGMASFLTAHNQDVAWGGSLGAPNWSDAFLLRLNEQQSGPAAGRPTAALEYYSYYSDSMQSLSTPPQTQCVIKRHDSGTITIPYWRAGPFGVVLPDLDEVVDFYEGRRPAPELPVIYGEEAATGPWEWRVQDEDRKMRFWTGPDSVTPPTTRDPMVIALRVPMDPNVGGETFHWLYPKAGWEMAHADSVADIHRLLNAQQASYFVNFCCVDRAGDLFATHLGAIPKRGDYDLTGGPNTLLANGIHSFPDLWAVYSGTVGPVPARRLEDRMFDWQFENGEIQYLDLATNGGSRAYKAKLEAYPSRQGAPQFPAWSEAGAGPTWTTQNGRFGVVNNSSPWFAGLKRALVEPDPANPNAFNNQMAVDPFNGATNEILQAVLDAGTAYQSIVFVDEASPNNQLVTDRLSQIAKTLSPNSPAGAEPPMTVAEAVDFVTDPTLHNAAEYPGGTALADLPPAIRVVKEIASNLTTPGWPRTMADREARFFHDLWDALHNHSYWLAYRAVGQPLNRSLKEIWIDNAHQQSGSNPAARQTMWYDDPQNPQTLRWLDMPIGFALIDFDWRATELGAGTQAATGMPGGSGFSAGDVAEFSALVNWLDVWGNSPSGRYKIAPDSSAAALYEMWRMGYTGWGPHGRHWRVLDDGTSAEWQPTPWSALAGNAFMYGRVESANETEPGLVIAPNVYDALYWDPATFQVRDAGHPLTAAHLNALTQFFLELGRFYVDPVGNGGNPSRKMARYELLTDPDANGLRDDMLATYPGSYPLTAGLVRMTAARRLMDAARFMGGLAAVQNQQLSTYFGARLCDHYGRTRWPSTIPGDLGACWGGELGGGGWMADPLSPGQVLGRGFQTRFVRTGFSNTPLLTLFPDNGGPPRSFFWTFPGARAMSPDDPGFTSLMPNVASNQLAPTYYSNYRPYYFTTHAYR